MTPILDYYKIMSESELLGKKIFFLYPSPVVQNQISAELIQQEFEVYTVKNYGSMRKILKKYPKSIVFIDIAEGMSEREWEAWIKGLMADREINLEGIGILTGNDDENLVRKYVNIIRVKCGYTIIKSDLNATIGKVLEVLKAVDARGRRKYIRVTTEQDTSATVNLPMHGLFVNGVIKDISVVGFSCAFTSDPGLVKNALIKDIQVKLQTSILKVEGIIFGSRMDGAAKVYVILFTQRIDPAVRVKIRKYIQSNLQAKMDAELEAM
jgi:hypothetical protein